MQNPELALAKIKPLNASIEADLDGAVCIAATGKSSKDTKLSRALTSFDELSKIYTNGTIDKVMMTELDITTGVNLVFISEDKSVYCNFNSPVYLVDNEGNNTQVWVQTIRITADNDVYSVWPIELTESSSISGLVLDRKHVQVIDNKIFFLNTNERKIYEYNPDVNNGTLTVIADLSVIADCRVYSFAVNDKNEVLVSYVSNEVHQLRYFVSEDDSNNILSISSETVPFGEANAVGSLFYITVNNLEKSGIYQLSIADKANFIFKRPLARFLIAKGGGVDSLINFNGSAWYRESALIVQNTDGDYEWNSIILTDGQIDQDKLYWLMRTYYASGFSIKAGTVDVLNNPGNFSGFVTQLGDTDGSFYKQITFCETYFNGILNDYPYSDLDMQNALFYIKSIHKLSSGIYAVGGAGSSSFKLFKLLNLDGGNDLRFITWDDQTIRDTSLLVQIVSVGSELEVVDNYLYFKYQNNKDSGSTIPLNYDFGRVNIETGDTEYFQSYTGRVIDIKDFSISSDNKFYYLSGNDVYTDEVINGKINLITKVWTLIDSDVRFEDLVNF